MLMDRNKNGSGSKPKTVCERLSGALRGTTPFRTTTQINPQHRRNVAAVVSSTAPNVAQLVPAPQGDFCLRVAPSDHEGQHVPMIFDATHAVNGSVKPYRQGTCGGKSMNVVFTEYIVRAGKKIRSPTIVSDPKGSMKNDSFNSKVSDFIDKTRHRFHMPSSLGVSKIVSEEELEFQVLKIK